jgi:hypothetical protein
VTARGVLTAHLFLSPAHHLPDVLGDVILEVLTVALRVTDLDILEESRLLRPWQSPGARVGVLVLSHLVLVAERRDACDADAGSNEQEKAERDGHGMSSPKRV